MKITCRRYLYKIVEPSQKGRVLTKWVEGQPLADFEAFEMTKVPLSVSNVEIENTYHEITKKRANKLYEEKNGPTTTEEQPVVEEPAEPKIQ